MCGGSGGGGGGGGRERQRVTKVEAVACGGGVRLFSVTRDGTLRGECHRPWYIGGKVSR